MTKQRASEDASAGPLFLPLQGAMQGARLELPKILMLTRLRTVDDWLKVNVRRAPHHQSRAKSDVESIRGAVIGPHEAVSAKNRSFCASRDMPLASHRGRRFNPDSLADLHDRTLLTFFSQTIRGAGACKAI